METTVTARGPKKHWPNDVGFNPSLRPYRSVRALHDYRRHQSDQTHHNHKRCSPAACACPFTACPCESSEGASARRLAEGMVGPSKKGIGYNVERVCRCLSISASSRRPTAM